MNDSTLRQDGTLDAASFTSLASLRAWYDVPLQSKLSAHEGGRHVAIVGSQIRVALVPATPDAAIPIEEYLLDHADCRRLAEQLLVRGVSVHLYGAFVSRDGADASPVESAYRAIADRYGQRLHFAGRADFDTLAVELSRYDGVFLSGFVPYQPVPQSSHRRLPASLHPISAARVPLFVAAGTADCLEREIASTGAGFVVESFDEIVDRLSSDGALARASNAAHDSQDRYCADARSASRKIRSSSQAA